MKHIDKDIPALVARMIAAGLVRLPDPAGQIKNFAEKMEVVARCRERAAQKLEAKRAMMPKGFGQCRFCGTKSNKHAKFCKRPQ